jgi:hypothetical protein
MMHSPHSRLRSRWNPLLTLCLIISAIVVSSAFASCARADALPSDAIGTSVSYFGEDSALVVARWTRAADVRGGADAYQVNWSRAGTQVRAVRVAATVDSLRTTRAAISDSVLVGVAVTAFRRGSASVASSRVVWLFNPDSPPPPVDSLVIDTLVADVAFRDTFPSITIRDSTGAPPRPYIAVGQTFTPCLLARNRYTSEVVVIVGAALTVPEQDAAEARCARAVQAMQHERSG